MHKEFDPIVSKMFREVSTKKLYLRKFEEKKGRQ